MKIIVWFQWVTMDYQEVVKIATILGQEGNVLETKYPYVVHAELNAILNSKWPVKDCTIYVSLFPCNECAKAIIQSGIRRVVYESDKYNGTEMNIASKRMLESAGVELIKLPYSMSLQVEIKEGE